MTARLPSLNGLRAFEAAARHLSFTQAASELNVTQTAISHQIKRLEEELGVRLFVRQNRALTLTPAGAGIPPRHPRRLQRSAARDRPAAAQGRRPCADGLDAGLAGRQMAAAAAVRVPGSASRHRRAHHHLDQPGRLPARRCRCRDPLRPRPVAGPARRLADGGRAVPGVQPRAAQRQQAAEMPGRPRRPRAAAHQQRQQRRLAAVADGGRPADRSFQAARRDLRPDLHDRAGRDRRRRRRHGPHLLCAGRHRQRPPGGSLQDHAAGRRRLLSGLARGQNRSAKTVGLPAMADGVVQAKP